MKGVGKAVMPALLGYEIGHEIADTQNNKVIYEKVIEKKEPVIAADNDNKELLIILIFVLVALFMLIALGLFFRMKLKLRPSVQHRV